MNIRFDGKIVVVTGAGHGFGRCIAQTFSNLGAVVHGCDLSADELKETASHANIDTRVVDLADRKAAAEWIKDIEARSSGPSRPRQQRRRRRRAGHAPARRRA